MKGKLKLLIFIGIIITALPLLGFPRNIKTIMLFVFGLSVIFLGLSLKKSIRILKLKLKRAETSHDSISQI
ncbi:MAG: hypothetical protein QG674_148 [Patescibacteria group bacterium]|jgi:hypothetical protein|nr:hypothetical protein [Patescibacteria group bacterium]